MKSEGHPFERRAAARVRVAIQPRPGRRALGVLATTLATTFTLLLFLLLLADRELSGVAGGCQCHGGDTESFGFIG